MTTTTCTMTGCSSPVTAEVEATHAMGCRVMCSAHFLEYHHATSIAEVAERETARRAVRHTCARCGQPARWVAGAGQALCTRHAESY